MADGFPRKYSLLALAGVTARQFEKREDAFQQLIGDGLLAMAGHSAKSYPTKGEDGSIDSYLEERAALVAPLENLSLPAIIECKDHDDTLSGVSDNILGGWAKVRAKLTSQANDGWPELFRPWLKARSYVYVVSAVIPTQDVRETLERRISDFFTTLPAEARPPLERIIVLDWNDARLAAHASRARTVSSLGFSVLPHYFDRHTLECAKVVIVDRLPVPPLTRLGLPQFAEMEGFTQGGITFLDTFFVTVGERLDESLHFHELIHVIQWQLLGPERFLLHYAEGLQAHGYRNSPLEVMAYDAQDRFNQAILFEAEKHVAERLRALSFD